MQLNKSFLLKLCRLKNNILKEEIEELTRVEHTDGKGERERDGVQWTMD